MKLFPLFTSGAVLPRGRKFKIWGEAAPGEKIQLELAARTFETEADARGHWEVWLPSFGTGGLHRLTVTGENNSLVSENITFGDVYLLFGQSNMQLPVSRCLDLMPPFFDDLADDRIREHRLAIAPSFNPENRSWPEPSAWKSLTPQTLPDFGALGLAFARTCLEDEDVPIGLINCAVGGTPLESWMALEDLEDAPGFIEEFRAYRDPSLRRGLDEAYQEEVDAWFAEAYSAEPPADGYEPFGPDIFPDMFFGTPYENFNGVLWLRTRFTLTAEQAADEAPLLDLGCLYIADQTFVNGELAGETGYQYPPRKYRLRKGLLREGQNEILIRLMVPRGCGGAVPGKFYGLILSEATLPLGGDVWEIARGPELPELRYQRPWDRLAGTNYYAYLQPLEGYSFSAALWYQGESNDRNPNDYESRFPRLIRRCRTLFGPDLPFIFVQLTRYDDPAREVPEDSWAIIREAQRRALALPRTAMVVSIDVGESNDLHPQDKWSLGYRASLALKALRTGLENHGLSPEVTSWFNLGDRLRLYFRLVGHGLWSDGALCKSFRLIDPSGGQHAVEVLDIGENHVDLELPEENILESEALEAGTLDPHSRRGPTLEGWQLRYNYDNNPPYCYLRSSDGLPTSPFVLYLDEDATT